MGEQKQTQHSREFIALWTLLGDHDVFFHRRAVSDER
jgi:hypothetical protein